MFIRSKGLNFLEIFKEYYQVQWRVFFKNFSKLIFRAIRVDFLCIFQRPLSEKMAWIFYAFFKDHPQGNKCGFFIPFSKTLVRDFSEFLKDSGQYPWIFQEFLETRLRSISMDISGIFRKTKFRPNGLDFSMQILRCFGNLDTGQYVQSFFLTYI